MKLNIEELAVQAGGSVVGDSDPQCWSGLLSFEKEELEAFARLIVERCSQECDDLAGHLLAFHDRQGANIAVSLRDSIRNLMED